MLQMWYIIADNLQVSCYGNSHCQAQFFFNKPDSLKGSRTKLINVLINVYIHFFSHSELKGSSELYLYVAMANSIIRPQFLGSFCNIHTTSGWCWLTWPQWPVLELKLRVRFNSLLHRAQDSGCQSITGQTHKLNTNKQFTWPASLHITKETRVGCPWIQDQLTLTHHSTHTALLKSTSTN